MSVNTHRDLTLLREPVEPKNWLEKFTGPGTTQAESFLQFGIAILAAVAAVLYPLFAEIPWSWWQFIIAGFLGLDMMGGVATNATNSGKFWYHRRSQTNAKHFSFIALHAIQIALVYAKPHII